MINFLKQLEGRKYKDSFDDEYIIADIEAYEDGKVYFWVRPINDENNLTRFDFDELCIDFEEWL